MDHSRNVLDAVLIEFSIVRIFPALLEEMNFLLGKQTNVQLRDKTSFVLANYHRISRSEPYSESLLSQALWLKFEQS